MTSGKLSRRQALTLAGAGMAVSTFGASISSPAIAQASPLRWRLVTSWPKNRAGPGISAKRIVDRINAMAVGRLQIDLFAAGEIVPPFAVFDAVSTGTVEMGHSASLFWQGKIPSASIFTAVPFGLGPTEHQAWVEFRDGQALWDELYRPHNVRAFLAGNTGPCMGGFFRKKVETLDDLKGFRIRATGLGGEIYRRLGAVPMAVPPGDLLPAFEKGAVDAVEFLTPASDLETGLERYASYYYAPGFNKMNSASEFSISLKAWEQLSPDLQTIIMEVCRSEYAMGLAESHHRNASAIMDILSKNPITIEVFSSVILEAAKKANQEALDDIAKTSDIANRIVSSYRATVKDYKKWTGLASDMARSLSKT